MVNRCSKPFYQPALSTNLHDQNYCLFLVYIEYERKKNLQLQFRGGILGFVATRVFREFTSKVQLF